MSTPPLSREYPQSYNDWLTKPIPEAMELIKALVNERGKGATLVRISMEAYRYFLDTPEMVISFGPEYKQSLGDFCCHVAQEHEKSLHKYLESEKRKEKDRERKMWISEGQLENKLSEIRCELSAAKTELKSAKAELKIATDFRESLCKFLDRSNVSSGGH